MLAQQLGSELIPNKLRAIGKDCLVLELTARLQEQKEYFNDNDYDSGDDYDDDSGDDYDDDSGDDDEWYDNDDDVDDDYNNDNSGEDDEWYDNDDDVIMMYGKIMMMMMDAT